MGNFQGGSKRGIITPRVRAWIAISFLMIVCAWLGHAVWSIYQKNRLARAGRDETVRELLDLKKRQSAVDVKLSKMQTEQGVESAIRQTLPMAKEGEHVITIIDQTASDTSEGDASTTGSKPGFWAAVMKGL